jgi:hypothetical protein
VGLALRLTSTKDLTFAHSRCAGKRVLIDGFPRSIENLVDFEAVCGRAEVCVLPGRARPVKFDPPRTVCHNAVARRVQFVLWFDAPDEILVQRLLARGQQSGRYVYVASSRPTGPSLPS